MTDHYDIAICGAGLIGLGFACSLTKTNFKLVVFDAGMEPSLPTLVENSVAETKNFEFQSSYAPRVSALNLSSLNQMKDLGIFEHVCRSFTFKDMLVKDGSGTGGIQFNADDIKQDSLGLIVENQQLLTAMLKVLKAADNVTLKFETRLAEANPTADGYEVELEGDSDFNCSLLIGADGGNSIVRQSAGLKTLSWDYGQRALVTTIQTERAHGGVARQWFTPRGPLAFLPLANTHLCSIVWSLEDAEAHLDFDAETFCAELTEHSESDLGSVLGTDKRFSFPLMQQQAYRYVKPGLALIGDAAHTIHPLAGQGANLGLADARCLANEIKQSIFTDESVGDLRLLNRYVRARQPQNIAMSMAMEGFKRLFASQNPGLNWLRNQGMTAFDSNPLVKSTLARLASGQ